MDDLRERAARVLDSRFHLVVSFVIVCLALAVTGAWAADTTIGLYQDESGYSCSFNDAPGIVTAYVIIKPGTGGTRGVRFSAPVPSCFHATYVAETIPDLVVGTGNSQTGISLAHRDCQNEPFSVLAITYLNNGGTTPCCDYPILPDPFTGLLEALNCAVEPQPITSDIAHFNANASCPCGPGAPTIPTNPTPPDLSIDRPLNQTLAWEVDGNAQNLTYDVYFGTSQTPLLVASDITTATYDPGALEAAEIYFWMVVARNESGTEFPGPLWSFATVYPPHNPFPADGATNVPIPLVLSWEATDPEGDPLTFDVYFGPSTNYPPPLIATDITESNYNPGVLAAFTTYYWRVVQRDPSGSEVPGPMWTFATLNPNLPPTVPVNRKPRNGAVNVSLHPTLQWISSDPEGGPLTYDGFLGTSEPLTRIFSNRPSTSFEVNGLFPTTEYMWRIVARDNGGAVTVSPTWSFVTRENTPPIRFRGRPMNGATGQPINTILSWLALDIDAQTLTYDVYFGTNSPPGLVATNLANRQYFPGTQALGTLYFWRIVARDPYGAHSSSPIWSYTTRDTIRANEPPNATSTAILDLALHQNVPNPFNPQTTIRYDVPSAGRVRLLIFDVNGRLVRTLVDEEQSPGSREVTWTGRDDAGSPVSSGVYFYVLETDKGRLMRKLVLLK